MFARTPTEVRLIGLWATFLGLWCLLGVSQGADYRTVERVSTDSANAQANADSANPAISANGRFVVFQSTANTLVPLDTNNASDIFVKDRQSGITTRVSVGSGGLEADGASYNPTISANGQFVAFVSSAQNLVSGDNNGWDDVFVHDLQTGTTTRISISSLGIEANGSSNFPSLNANGRYVAFDSEANNLVSTDLNGVTDIFVRDLQTGTTARVNLSTGGAEANATSTDTAMSVDGRYVVFRSMADNLVTGDNNNVADIFLRDLQTSTTTRVSVNSAGGEANGASFNGTISAFGRYVVFSSLGSNLVASDTNTLADVFVHDRLTGETTRVSVSSAGQQANGLSDHSAISEDGRYVVFASLATNLVAAGTGQGDVYVHDRLTQLTSAVSLNLTGSPGNQSSNMPAMSADARDVVFVGLASNLVPGDTNAASDVFVTSALPGAPSGVLLFPSSETEVVVAWYQSDLFADSYLVERSTNGTFWTLLASLPSGLTSYVDPGLFCGNTYVYRVTAVNALGSATSAESASVTTPACPVDLVGNNGFEAVVNGIPTGWIGTRLTGDERVCGGAGYQSNCAFQFQGGKKENSNLRHVLADTSELTAGKKIRIGGWVQSENGSKATIIARLTYEKKGKKTIKISVKKGSYAYTYFESRPFKLPKNVQAATLELTHKGKAGIIRFDNLTVFVDQPAQAFPQWVQDALRAHRQDTRRDGVLRRIDTSEGLIPVPPAP